MQQEWARVTINISPEEYGQLQVLASIDRLSVSKFVRAMIRDHLDQTEGLASLINKVHTKAAKSS